MTDVFKFPLNKHMIKLNKFQELKAVLVEFHSLINCAIDKDLITDDVIEHFILSLNNCNEKIKLSLGDYYE